MSPFQSVEIIEAGAAVSLRDAHGRTIRFHAVWLRDNSADPDTRSRSNGQRLITLAEIARDTRIHRASLATSGDLEVEFGPDGKCVSFDPTWLRAHAYDGVHARAPGWLAPAIETWDRASLPAIPTAQFPAARDDPAVLAAWLAAVRRFGVAAMTGGPLESGAVARVAELFGFIRETNYGRWFEVRSAVDPTNLAYTNLGLQAHTDNPYRDPIPTLQILYCLENSADGGDSRVVDGFRVARRLRDEAPDAFDCLSGYCARFEYSGDHGVRLRARRPMIELAPDGELVAVRFNNRSCAPIVDVPYERMPAYYEAYRCFAELVDDDSMGVTFRLDPGECFIVDNTRILHGRTAFASTGTRWLQGCYPDRDGLLSTLDAYEHQHHEAHQA